MPVPPPLTSLTSFTPSRQADLHLRDVTKHYAVGGEVVQALAGVSLHIAAGECVAITGASGSGKSTLLNLIGGLDAPTSGHIWVGGEDISALSSAALCDYRRRRVGFIFQDFSLIPGQTAAQNTELPMIFAGVPRAHRRARAQRGLEQVGLAGRASHTPEQLSGGQKQRVAIARALVNEPDVILADEPTGNLDSATGREILALLLGVAQAGHAVLIVTHDPAIAARADRVIHMRDGRIVSTPDHWPSPPDADAAPRVQPRPSTAHAADHAPRPAAWRRIWRWLMGAG